MDIVRPSDVDVINLATLNISKPQPGMRAASHGGGSSTSARFPRLFEEVNFLDLDGRVTGSM